MMLNNHHLVSVDEHTSSQIIRWDPYVIRSHELRRVTVNTATTAVFIRVWPLRVWLFDLGERLVVVRSCRIYCIIMALLSATEHHYCYEAMFEHLSESTTTDQSSGCHYSHTFKLVFNPFITSCAQSEEKIDLSSHLILFCATPNNQPWLIFLFLVNHARFCTFVLHSCYQSIFSSSSLSLYPFWLAFHLLAFILVSDKEKTFRRNKENYWSWKHWRVCRIERNLRRETRSHTLECLGEEVRTKLITLMTLFCSVFLTFDEWKQRVANFQSTPGRELF